MVMAVPMLAAIHADAPPAMVAAVYPGGPRARLALTGLDGRIVRYLTARDPRFSHVAPSFSPDGRSVAYVALHVEPGLYERELRVVAASGGSPRTLARQVGSSMCAPAWDAAGGRIAYVQKGAGYNGIAMIDASSGAVTQLTRPSNDEDQCPAWVSDRHLVFRRATLEPPVVSRLMRIDVRMRRLVAVYRGPLLVDHPWAIPGSRRLVVIAADTSQRPVTSRIATGVLAGDRAILRPIGPRTPAVRLEPVISADGSRIAYIVGLGGRARGYVMNADGSCPRSLRATDSVAFSPLVRPGPIAC